MTDINRGQRLGSPLHQVKFRAAIKRLMEESLLPRQREAA
jgi:hypothetical protein